MLQTWLLQCNMILPYPALNPPRETNYIQLAIFAAGAIA